LGVKKLCGKTKSLKYERHQENTDRNRLHQKTTPTRKEPTLNKGPSWPNTLLPREPWYKSTWKGGQKNAKKRKIVFFKKRGVTTASYEKWKMGKSAFYLSKKKEHGWPEQKRRKISSRSKT